MIRILNDVPMANLTTFKIGGKVKEIYVPESSADVAELVKKLASFRVLGNGSNILVCDEGIDTPVIHISHAMSAIEISGTTLRAEAGAPLSRIASEAARASLGGFEFAAGIPGSVGGAVIMNAGAYGGEMRDVVKSVTFADKRGLCTYTNEEMCFGYRHSALSDMQCVVCAVQIELKETPSAEIYEKMNTLAARRRDKQPLEYPSAGSTFKRPEGYFAAALIEECNLKGMAVGGACVSDKHAGFVINKGNATAADVKALVELIKKTVYEKTGVKLECEIKIWG